MQGPTECSDIANPLDTPIPITPAINFHNTLTQDPYNWNFPKKSETMYLSTIQKKDIGFNNYSSLRQSSSLYTKDIIGTRRLLEKQETQTQNLRNDDIEQSQPRKLNQPLNKEYYYLRNDDIEGSRPRVNWFKTNRLPSNPLNPEYKLPSFEPIEPEIPKFVRDSINIDDIRGSKPKTFHNRDKRVRNLMDITDIDGSRPKKEYLRQDITNPLTVKDINEYRIFKTSRVTNPLDPEYVVQGEEKNSKMHIGKVEGSCPKELHPKVVNKTQLFSLINQDIDGSQVNTTGNQIIKSKQRRDLRNINLTKDIPGAQASTLKKGITTKRQLHPLVPDYKYPGHIQDEDYIRSIYDPTFKQSGVVEKSHSVAKLVENDASAKSRKSRHSRAASSKHSQLVPTPKSRHSDLPEQDFVFDSAVTPTPKIDQLPQIGKGSNSAVQQPKIGNGKLPLHMRINKEKYELDKIDFYGVQKTSSVLKSSNPTKMTKLQRFDKLKQNA